MPERLVEPSESASGFTLIHFIEREANPAVTLFEEAEVPIHCEADMVVVVGLRLVVAHLRLGSFMLWSKVANRDGSFRLAVKDPEKQTVEIAAEADDLRVVSRADLAVAEKESVVARRQHDRVLCVEVLNCADHPKALSEKLG